MQNLLTQDLAFHYSNSSNPEYCICLSGAKISGLSNMEQSKLFWPTDKVPKHRGMSLLGPICLKS